jgi:PAS domain S-box-containing protein
MSGSEGHYRALFEQSAIPMTTHRGGLVLDANRAALSLFRCDDPSRLIGHKDAERFAPQALAALDEQAPGDPQELTPATFETVGLRFDGSELPLLVQRVTIELPDGPAVLATYVDLSDQKHIEAERMRLEERVQLASAVEQTADSIWMQDTDNIVSYVNPSFSRVYGYEPAEIVGRHAGMVDSGHHGQTFFAEIWATAAAGRTWAGSIINRRKDGTLFEVEAVISRIVDGAGHLIGYMQTDRDVTRERALESAIELDARERKAIATALGRIDSAATIEEIAATACAEIIGLSNVESASVVILEADRGYVLAFEGFNAGVVPGHLPLPEARLRYLRARAASGPWVDAWRGSLTDYASLDLNVKAEPRGVAYAPFECAGDTIGLITIVAYDQVNAALLVERLPALVTFGSIVGTLIRPGLGARRRAADDRTAIQAIIDTSAVRPFFQPIVDLSDGAVVGHEALTRFADGRSPSGVFAEATRAGLGVELEMACLRASIDASDRLPEDTFLSINASPELVLSGSLGSLLSAVPRPMVLEITEHVAVSDYNGLRRELKRLGPAVRLAVDDAGAGFASFRHILELAPDFVKIDIDLVRNLDAEPARQALIAGMGHFAAQRELLLVAEGIETAKELEALRALAVPYGQGYLLGRPRDGLASHRWPSRIDLAAFKRS